MSSACEACFIKWFLVDIATVRNHASEIVILQENPPRPESCYAKHPTYTHDKPQKEKNANAQQEIDGFAKSKIEGRLASLNPH
ncbi:hypothetical protein K0M31_010539 [Melipona bicolor]|uniref:Uncharacterized protein n=1 Tax=Melipona bicolor TaxID=60889 RepID=A0AA40FLW1_9HYME|nr:hypothetical protein K0M31_010539 [Melipona bicolor]